MTPHIRILAIALLVSARMICPSWADQDQTKIDLQAALLNFLEMTSDPQGRFRVIDRASGRVLHTHAGAMHPKIVPFGDDRVLCIEMYDRAGGRHDADLMRLQTEKYVCCQAVHSRSIL